jgi:drug/metabolite transporter (DMT)-like permease
VSLVLALAAGLLWGSADYCGGLLTRRIRATSVVLFSHSAALAGITAVILLRGGGVPVGRYLLFGVAAGAVSTAATLAFYKALAAGPMGLVGSLEATGVTVPVMVGVARGERLSLVQVAGVALAVAGAVLASGPELRSGLRIRRRTILLALVAALGFGTVLPLLAEGGRTNVIGTLAAQRATNLLMLGACLAALGTGVAVHRRSWPVLAFVGAADVGANALYVLATRSGLVSIASVLASLYPVVTALLARQLLGERLRRVQTVGIAAALGGVMLLASS